MIKRVKTKKNVVPVSANLEEKGPHIGNFLNNSLQGNKDSSCSSALRGENYPETSSGQVFETGKGKKIKVVEVYGNKPINEVLEAFSKYISQFF